MTGIIKSIKIYPIKGDAGREVHEANLIEDHGLEGDFHAKGGDRQISLLFAENFIFDQTKQGLCLSRFRENISIRFSEPVDIHAGMQLKTEEAILEITSETKRCHDECSLYEAGKQCQLAGQSLFARILKGGIVRDGERVYVEQNS